MCDELKKHLAVPLQAGEAISNKMKEEQLRQSKLMEAQMHALLDRIPVDEAAIRKKALTRVADELEEVLTKGSSIDDLKKAYPDAFKPLPDDLPTK